ncbi:hypothetical protein [Streptomyces niveus]|uniref:hypothetical protein n=1 Tax=Streptomyces niveus TaxID=193462 RepID=UPI0036D41DB8
MERKEMKQLAMAALQCTVNGEPEAAATIVNALASTGDSCDLYGACCGWAGSAEVALERIHGRPAGDVWSFEEHPGNPEKTFALRFIAAYANDDPTTTEALFVAAANASSDQTTDSVASLLQMAADLNTEAQAAR